MRRQLTALGCKCMSIEVNYKNRVVWVDGRDLNTHPTEEGRLWVYENSKLTIHAKERGCLLMCTKKEINDNMRL